jgi:hypothetical protein
VTGRSLIGLCWNALKITCKLKQGIHVDCIFSKKNELIQKTFLFGKKINFKTRVRSWGVFKMGMLNFLVFFSFGNKFFEHVSRKIIEKCEEKTYLVLSLVSRWADQIFFNKSAASFGKVLRSFVVKHRVSKNSHNI